MKKLILTTLIAATGAAFSRQAAAQAPYSVSMQTGTYQPLTNASSANHNHTWNSDSTFTLPIGFGFRLNGQVITTVDLSPDGLISHATGSKISGFGFLNASLHDRGEGTATSRSPVRYITSGTSGSRIFKVELFNAGFEEEASLYNTNHDSVNMQIWLYEGTDAVELRYGASRLTDFKDYFGPFLFPGYVKNYDFNTFTIERFYYLMGTTTAPMLDSTSTLPPPAGFTQLPAAGSVYKFSPRTNSTGIGRAAVEAFAKVYPSFCLTTLFIDQLTANTLRYQIVNSAGALISEGMAPANSRQQLDVSTLPAGLYYIRLTDSEGAWQLERFMKQ